MEAPLVRYTVEFVWPTTPDRFRPAVTNVAERVARRSVGALLRMGFRTRLTLSFYAVDGENEQFLATQTTAQWDAVGRASEGDPGRYERWIPAWALGRDPVERGSDERVPVGS